jgi:hypothetical protein
LLNSKDISKKKANQLILEKKQKILNEKHRQINSFQSFIVRRILIKRKRYYFRSVTRKQRVKKFLQKKRMFPFKRIFKQLF